MAPLLQCVKCCISLGTVVTGTYDYCCCILFFFRKVKALKNTRVLCFLLLVY